MRGRLLEQPVADPAQRGWVMRGRPMARATSADGRWAYTLYTRPGGYPFVHALDTVGVTARCIGLPFTGDQGRLARLKLTDGGRELAIRTHRGSTLLTIDTGTLRLAT